MKTHISKSLNFLLLLILPSLATARWRVGACADWCVAPYCQCQSGWLFSRNVCADGYSGDQCRCPFSRTNIAAKNRLFPDSLSGSLELTSGPSGEVLAGTWTSAYESSDGDGKSFSSWLPNTERNNENVWSITKTEQGTKMVGTPDGIQIKRVDDTAFRFVLRNDGTHGTMVSVGSHTFAGTFDGLLLSEDEGETWTRVPSTCGPYDIPSSDVFKPPAQGSWCDEGVTKLLYDDSNNSVIAFFMGYGGAHRYFLDSNADPTAELSWEALPTFHTLDPEKDLENGSVCAGGFCFVQDATVYNGHLYAALRSSTLVRIGMSDLNAGWEEISISPEVNRPGIAGLATAQQKSILFASTVEGLYKSYDGAEWEIVSEDACPSRTTPPLMQQGLIATIDEMSLVVGTIYGPWTCRIEP